MMNYVVFLSNVSPGPACSIPDDKKIFRVSGDDEAAISLNDPQASIAAADDFAENLPLPVPHMYSA